MPKFAVVSDVHAEQHYDWTTLIFERMGARSSELDFVACLGDWTTNPHNDRWDRYLPRLLSHIKCPLFCAIGNHDDIIDDWLKQFSLPLDYLRYFGNMRAVFFDSIHWKHDDPKRETLDRFLSGCEPYKFLFTHFTPKIGHWDYGMGVRRTQVLLDLCEHHKVTACFTGHMHGFDYQRKNGIHFFICGGGGGGRHDNFPILHRSNFYLLVEYGERFHVTLCQQHRNSEELHPMEKWQDETRRPAW